MKTAIWIVTVLGLAPAGYLGVIGAQLLSATLPLERWMNKNPSVDVRRHDSYAGVGPARIRFYPRVWAVVVAGAGIILVLGSLFVMLHVPGPGD